MKQSIKVFIWIIAWLFLVYMQMIGWDLFDEWTRSFRWDELSGSVFYVAWMKFAEIFLAVFLLLMMCAMIFVPSVLIMREKKTNKSNQINNNI